MLRRNRRQHLASPGPGSEILSGAWKHFGAVTCTVSWMTFNILHDIFIFGHDTSFSSQLWKLLLILLAQDFLVCSVVKESACHCRRRGDAGSIPGSGRLPRGGNDNPLQYSCLKNKQTNKTMDWGAWQAAVYGVVKRRMWLSACILFLLRLTSVLITLPPKQFSNSPFHSCTHCLNS